MAEPYLARSKCFIQLGEVILLVNSSNFRVKFTFQYAKAASDASLAHMIEPNSLRSLFSKAYALYNIGAFEHAMLHFYR